VRRVTSAQGWEVPMTGIVPRFTETPGSIRHPGAPLGAHTDGVLRELLGLGDDELAALRAEGVLA
jgi:crotonobetainyl-CoA:carnitine CoA-transferase CaiB-like acyl-CoA transferase